MTIWPQSAARTTLHFLCKDERLLDSDAIFYSIAVQLINIFLTRYDDDMAFKKEMTQEHFENDRKKDEQMFRFELR